MVVINLKYLYFFILKYLPLKSGFPLQVTAAESLWLKVYLQIQISFFINSSQGVPFIKYL
jgi:hypothetical protein